MFNCMLGILPPEEGMEHLLKSVEQCELTTAIDDDHDYNFTNHDDERILIVVINL